MSLEDLMIIADSCTYEKWDEDKTPYKRVLQLDASTYRMGSVFDIAPSSPPLFSDGEVAISPKETFAFQNRILPKGQPLRLHGERQGIVFWNGPVTIPMLIDLNRNSHSGERFAINTSMANRIQTGAPWMSLTPMEMLTQRSAVQMAAHKVVIGGLGLGWLLKKVCEKPEVESVIVVEKSRELLDWYGYRMCSQFEKVKEVICDDIYGQLDNHGVYARYLIDIWPTYSGAAHDLRLRPFRRKLKRRLWAWGLN